MCRRCFKLFIRQSGYVTKLVCLINCSNMIPRSCIFGFLSGLSDDELYQYVTYDTVEQRKGPRRINLDDEDNKGKYTPPKSLTVHLSKIPMPELQPKANQNDKPIKETKKKEDKSKKKE